MGVASRAGGLLVDGPPRLDLPTNKCHQHHNPPTQCALGDAYRCGGCPYRGLPAFELGKKIELPSDFLVTDA